MMNSSTETELHNNESVGASASSTGKNKGRWLVLGVIAMTVSSAAAVAVLYRTTQASVLSVTVAEVKSEALVHTITGSGRVVSKKRVDVTSPFSGTIASVMVKERDSVRHGQVLATLDDRKEKARVEQAEAKVKNAQADVAMTQASLEAIMAKVTSGVLPARSLGDAELAIENTRAYLQLSREELQVANLALERHTITAPFDGVVFTSHVKEGSRTESSGILFTLVDPRVLEIEVQVDEKERTEIFPGQSATLTSSAFPGKEWTEEVVRIAPARKGDSSGSSVAVLLALSGRGPAMTIGQTVQAQIRVSTQASVLRIPADTVGKSPDGRDVVGLVTDGKVHYAGVMIGTVTPAHVEIREGLSAGQQVLHLQKMAEWPIEGAAVRVVDTVE